MRTGDCAGFGKQPNATARRLLSRALWVGGLAVAGSVFGAATASAAEAEPREEQSGGPLGTLTSAVEPVADVSGSPAEEPREKPVFSAQAVAFPARPERSTLDHTPNTSADNAPRHSHETGAARAAGQDGETAVIHSSLDVGTDGQVPSDGTRGGLRPSLLVTPVAGLSVLHVVAPGAATSADQAGPSSHALLPEEAVLRARLFSAAAYARDVEVEPLREANDPPVSPD